MPNEDISKVIAAKKRELNRTKKQLNEAMAVFEEATKKLESDPTSTLYYADYVIAKAAVSVKSSAITIIESELYNLSKIQDADQPGM